MAFKNRYAPHNVYTNFTNLSALGFEGLEFFSNFEGFSRKEDSTAKEKNATQIQVNISGFSYNSTYVYQENCNCYLRSQPESPIQMRMELKSQRKP